MGQKYRQQEVTATRFQNRVSETVPTKMLSFVVLMEAASQRLIYILPLQMRTTSVDDFTLNKADYIMTLTQRLFSLCLCLFLVFSFGTGKMSRVRQKPILY
jgi:hypothetical protein